MKRFKEIWFWFWGDGSTPHPKIMPYTIPLVKLIFILAFLYKGLKYLYNLIF